jgi:hypothetical protein
MLANIEALSTVLPSEEIASIENAIPFTLPLSL